MSDFSNVAEIALAVLKANASVATLVLAGIIATYAGIWDKQGISDLGKLVFHMSMPALVFGKVLDEISVAVLQELWMLPVACFLHIMSAYVVMTALNFVFRLEEADGKAALAATMFGNCGSLAIAVISALCASDPLMTEMGGQAACSARGVSYCAIYVIAWNILLWGLGDALLFPDSPGADPHAPAVKDEKKEALQEPMVEKKPRCSVMDNSGHELARVVTHGNLDDHESGKPMKASFVASKKAFRQKSSIVVRKDGVEKEHEAVEIKLTKEALKIVESRIPAVGGLYQSSVLEDKPSRLTTHVWQPIVAFCKKLIASPPIQAATLALALGLYAPLKAVFVGKDAPLGFILVASNQMGNAQVPASMVMLSGSGTLRYLQKIKDEATKELKEQLGEDVEVTTFDFSFIAKVFILFGRLVIMPFVGYFWWWLFVSQGWWPGDPASESYGKGMLGFICLIEACVPTAQSIVTMFIVHGDVVQGGAIAELILVQMALSVVLFSGAAAYFEILTL
eukprot:TRINITY_DN27016_c0_g1_i1.p1 TRINITY_DN27016_c0_g1~~TRINITY_DN27016_c0_g1_i1.p1  ORF type:complete len:510 (-),score=119.52 TRINITY_DN27016_c0_g1_i1:179-1708(-)